MNRRSFLSTILAKITWRARKIVGSFLWRTNESGHSRLCRILRGIAHDGPHGTFVCVDRLKLESGGNLCTFGVQCGRPTESYINHVAETSEAMMRTMRMLEKTGALQTHIWENPRFSAKALCECGNNNNRRLPDHDPLCPYRIEHDHPVTIEEYRAALNRQLQ